VFTGCAAYTGTVCDGTTSADQTCTACDAGYYKNLGVGCTLCTVISGCASYNAACLGGTSTDQTCGACEPGYYISATPACVQCTTPAGCATYTASGCTGMTAADQTCATCITGYVLTGATCSQCMTVTGCNSYTVNCTVGGTLPCLGCTSIYTFNTGACDPIPQTLAIETVSGTVACQTTPVQFIALIVYMDGTTLDVSADPLTAWSINGGCTISTSGLVTGCTTASTCGNPDLVVGANYNSGVVTAMVDFSFPMTVPG